MSAFTGTSTNSNMDNNVYANGLGNAFVWRAAVTDSFSFFNSFTTWQNDILADGHSSYVLDAKIDSAGHPLPDSALIDNGANLTSLGIAALNYDKDGAARHASGAWDIGAYEYVIVSPPADTTPPAMPRRLRLKGK